MRAGGETARLSKGPRSFHDLESEFFNDRIGQHFLGNALDLLLRFVAIPAVEIQYKKFALPHLGNLCEAQARESVVNRLTLWIENSTLRHYPHMCFHGPQYINSHMPVHPAHSATLECEPTRPARFCGRN